MNSKQNELDCGTRDDVTLSYGIFIDELSVVMLSVIMLSILMLSVIMLSVIMLSIIMPIVMGAQKPFLPSLTSPKLRKI
jgi:hypothetical protein